MQSRTENGCECACTVNCALPKDYRMTSCATPPKTDAGTGDVRSGNRNRITLPTTRVQIDPIGRDSSRQRSRELQTLNLPASQNNSTNLQKFSTYRHFRFAAALSMRSKHLRHRSTIVFVTPRHVLRCLLLHRERCHDETDHHRRRLVNLFRELHLTLRKRKFPRYSHSTCDTSLVGLKVQIELSRTAMIRSSCN